MPTYKLEPYRSRDNRFTCPSCGKPHCFTRYIDTDGHYVHPTVGKCDHVQSCGYHLTPKDFYRSNPWESPHQRTKFGAHPPVARPKPPAPVYLPADLPTAYSQNGPDNLIRYLSRRLNYKRLREVLFLYHIGTTSPSAYRAPGIIYWQIDRFNRVHDGKIMWYRPDGHRQQSMTWVSSRLKQVGRYPDQQTVKCLFGEHLIDRPGLTDLPVCLVESEKSAIIMATLYPDYLWLASCGCGGLNRDKVHCLWGRSLYVFPDAGEHDRWASFFDESGFGLSVERIANIDQYPPNTDIADIILDNIKPIGSSEPFDIDSFLTPNY